jgi:hypothetical protein
MTGMRITVLAVVATPDIRAVGLPAFRQRRLAPGHRTAAGVGLTVPQSSLRRADEVIR